MDDVPYEQDRGDDEPEDNYEALVVMLRNPSFQNSMELRARAAEAIEELLAEAGYFEDRTDEGIRNFSILSKLIHEKDAEIERLKVIIAWKVDPPT